MLVTTLKEASIWAETLRHLEAVGQEEAEKRSEEVKPE